MKSCANLTSCKILTTFISKFFEASLAIVNKNILVLVKLSLFYTDSAFYNHAHEYFNFDAIRADSFSSRAPKPFLPRSPLLLLLVL